MVAPFRQFLAAILSIVLAGPGFFNSPNERGNRTQKVSTLPGYPGETSFTSGFASTNPETRNYNANDQLSADTYDSAGNTTASNNVGYVYDFENRLVQAGGGISIVYDGDGNRVSKTVAGVTTAYRVDDQNPTGYAQVVSEAFSGATGARELSHAYVYGLERISEQRSFFTGTQSLTQFIYYAYDGHGSVRLLTDTSGNVTDTYDYDAFGNLIHSTGTTPNNYLFAGEQFDPDLGLYYNRARFLNVTTGRFWSMDTEQGDPSSPLSLHKYLYANGDPVNGIDPSGHEDLATVTEAAEIGVTIDATPIVKGVVLLAYLVAEFSGGIVETPDVSAPPAERDPRFPNSMRVQLQEGLDNTFYGVAQFNTAQTGVTVFQMRSALQTLYDLASNDGSFGRKGFPFNALDSWLVTSVIIASQKLGTYPPGGIPFPRRSFINIPTTWYRGKEYRLDVDNLAGHNLRQ